MFGFVKKLLGRKDDGSEGAASQPAASPKTPAPAVPVSARTGGSGNGTGSVPTQPPPPKSGGSSAGGGNGTVQVSLLGVVSLLPSELKPARAVGDLAGVQFSFPERPILEQLSQGCVRVTFGEIRKLAPEGLFTAGHEHDQKLIELPLQELLPQLHARNFGRRSSQKTTHVPDEVTNLFSARGNVVAPTSKAPSSQNGQPSSGGGTAQFTRPAPAAPVGASTAKPTAPTPSHASPSAATAPSDAAPKAKAPIGFSVALPAAPSAAAAAQSSPAKPAAGAKPSPVSAPAPAPQASIPKNQPAPAAAPPSPEPVVEPSKPIAAPNLLAAMKASAPAPAAAPAPATKSASGPGSEIVSFNLGQLSGGWAEAVRADIAQWKLENASVGIPAEEIAAALKLGRVKYTWGDLISRIPGAEGKQSAAAAVEVELPLPIVAPAFLSRPRAGSNRPATARGAAAQAQDIPDLFHAGKPAAAEAPAPTARPAAEPAATAKTPAIPGTGLLKTRPAAPAAPASASAPASVAPSAPASTPASGQVLGVPLAMIDESWPDALKTEISRCQIPGVKMEMPVEELDRSLKSGKIEYTWRQLRSWIRPVLPGEVGAEHADRLLTLPLKVIAPLFLSQVKANQARKKLEANSDIPDLFSGGPGSQPPAAAIAAEPAAPAQPAAAAPSPAGKPGELGASSGEISGATTYSTTQFFRKPPADLGELFGQPGKRNWTPNDIVQNTCRIRGVSGAVIAMQDGLLVSGQVASPWKSEATAAFLPQIYSRLNQYLKELSVGEMSSVTLNTANGTLFVFNAGIIYFAVISKPDETVPLAPIKLIVSELSRHTK